MPTLKTSKILAFSQQLTDAGIKHDPDKLCIFLDNAMECYLWRLSRAAKLTNIVSDKRFAECFRGMLDAGLGPIITARNDEPTQLVTEGNNYVIIPGLDEAKEHIDKLVAEKKG